MIDTQDNALGLVKRIERKSVKYIDLLTSDDDSEFEDAFEAILEKAIVELESNKRGFERLDEDALSSVLAMGISIPGVLLATRETHSNGHVDLTIVVEDFAPMRRKLGEAKIYDGPEYHFRGLEQLLGRYTTGRESRGFLIIYFRKRDIKALINKLRAKMDGDLPCDQQGPTRDHAYKWAFLSTHAHSCGEKLEVGHFGCNLFVDGASTKK